MTNPSTPASTPEGPDSLVGRTVADRYEVRSRLGQGGMGVVYAAVQRPLGRTVALKVLLRELTRDPTAKLRFEKEALAISRLSHPNIVTLFDFGTTLDGLPFIAMEFLDGVTLRALLAREAPLSPRRTVRILVHVARALAEAHGHHVVHRDLKPDNIMMVPTTGEADFAKVLDFGVARLGSAGDVPGTRPPTLTDSNVVLGTPRYMSPEQANGVTDDPRSDLYALGVIAFEMLAGRPPFEAETPMRVLLKHLQEPPPPLRAVNAACRASAELEALVMRMLAKDPARRVQGAEVLLRLLEEVPEYTGPRRRLITVAQVPSLPSMAALADGMNVDPSAPTPAVGVGEAARAATVMMAAADAERARAERLHGNDGSPGDGEGTPQTSDFTDTDKQPLPPHAVRALRHDTAEMNAVFTHAAIPAATVDAPRDDVLLPGSEPPSRPREADERTAHVARPPRGFPGMPGADVPNTDRPRVPWALAAGSALLVVGVGAVVTAVVMRARTPAVAPVGVPALAEVVITVTTDPPGAHVFEGALDRGAAPARLQVTRGAAPTYRVVMPGHRDATVHVDADADKVVHVRLEQENAPVGDAGGAGQGSAAP